MTDDQMAALEEAREGVRKLRGQFRAILELVLVELDQGEPERATAFVRRAIETCAGRPAGVTMQ